MSERVEFVCPACRNNVSAPPSLAGAAAPCPKCGQHVASWPPPISNLSSPQVNAAGWIGPVALAIGAAAALVVIAGVAVYLAKAGHSGVDANEGPSAIVVKEPADLAGMHGQYVELVGTVKSAGAGSEGTAIVILRWGAGTEVQCRFTDGGNWIAVTGPGERFTVRGTVTSLLPGLVFLKDCERVKR